jgi:hypothetical protein
MNPAMTPKTVVIRIATDGGGPLLDPTALGLLFGIAPETIRAQVHYDSEGYATFPLEWIRAGRRRAREAAAHTGIDDMGAVLAYWARQDHNAELAFVHEAATS